jgi:hypothetical protein
VIVAVDHPSAPAPRYRVGEPLPQVLTLRELGPILGLGYTRLWQLEKAGELERFECPDVIGNKKRYSGRKLQAWAEAQDAEPAPADVPRLQSRHFRRGRP